MKARRLGLIVIVGMGFSMQAALAQSTDSNARPGAKQDMKNAGSDTKSAATSTGHGVSHGTQKAYDKTKSGTETGYHKTVQGTKTGYNKTVQGTKTGYHKTTQTTENGVHKVEGKPSTPPNSPPQ